MIKNTIQIRLMHWKKQGFSLLFWLVLPIVATGIALYFVDVVKDDSKIPVGLVNEDESSLAAELVHSMKESPFLNVKILKKEEATHQLEKHELDSVFIIRKGYEENIQKGNRNRLLTGMQSDLSFAYSVTSEMILSFVQQDAGRMKAAFEIEKLYSNNDRELPEREALISRSKEIEEQQQLLNTSITFKESVVEKNPEQTTLNPWIIWAYISLFTTIFLFDWVIKEKQVAVKIRFNFTKQTFKYYLIGHFLLYTTVLFFFDLVALIFFTTYYDMAIANTFLLQLFVFRITLNLIAFLFSLLTKRVFMLYFTGISLTLMSAVFSVMGFSSELKPYLLWFHPLQAFLTGTYFNLWLIAGFLICLILLIWRGDNYAKS